MREQTVIHNRVIHNRVIHTTKKILETYLDKKQWNQAN